MIIIQYFEWKDILILKSKTIFVVSIVKNSYSLKKCTVSVKNFAEM